MTMGRLPHDRSDLLWQGGREGGPTDLFEESIARWLRALVSDDESDIGGPEKVIGKVRAKERGRIAGCIVIDRLVSMQCTNSILDWKVSEGDQVDSGDLVLSIEGPAGEILGCERILLNVLGRMSGISTNVARWVQLAGGMSVACTRKTDWGLLDKWAVHIGGGLTHRLSRSDALMIKENDIALVSAKSMDDSIANAIGRIDMDRYSSFTTIEVSSSSHAISAVSAWAEIQYKRERDEKLVLMLDNMGPDACEEADKGLTESGLREWCILEASGGISLGDVEKWRDTQGIDLISSSSLNRGVPPLDLSMIVGDA